MLSFELTHAVQNFHCQSSGPWKITWWMYLWKSCSTFFLNLQLTLFFSDEKKVGPWLWRWRVRVRMTLLPDKTGSHEHPPFLNSCSYHTTNPPVFSSYSIFAPYELLVELNQEQDTAAQLFSPTGKLQVAAGCPRRPRPCSAQTADSLSHRRHTIQTSSSYNISE